jgi:dihydropyrimidinase/allantoinase
MAFDLVVKDGRMVIPKLGIYEGDIGIENGKIAAIGKDIKSQGSRVVNASGKVILPGVVDAHSHIGIYRPLEQDAVSESTAAVTGGITTVLNIIRPRPYYLNMTGALESVLKELLRLSEKSFLTDYGYALAPVERSHLNEIEGLVSKGVSTFKFFMHYRDFKFSDEPYDTGFLLELMREVASANKTFGDVRLSLHCEDPEVIRVSGHTGYGLRLDESVRGEERELDKLPLLEAYNKARPPLSEATAIAKAIQLASATECPINILHVTSELAMDAAVKLLNSYRAVDATIEVEIHHLTLTTASKAGVFAKVNPPIRDGKDVEALWRAINENHVDVVASDHASTPTKLKEGGVWSAMFGFGGNTLLLPGIVSEGYHRRGLPLTRIAELLSYNPARIHGFYPAKGSIMVGSDADLVVLDLNMTKKVTASILNSAQEFTPFEGMVIKGWPSATLVRGEVMFENGSVTGKAGHGRYIPRPVSRRGEGEAS